MTDPSIDPDAVRILGTLRNDDGTGVVRLEERFDTDVEDLWSALTDPERLARWLGEVDGDLTVGGTYRAHYFASGWEGTCQVEACERPHRIVDQPEEATSQRPQRKRCTDHVHGKVGQAGGVGENPVASLDRLVGPVAAICTVQQIEHPRLRGIENIVLRGFAGL